MNCFATQPGSHRWRNVGAVVLCLFATTAMVGDLLGSRSVKGLGAVSAAAPFPKVFCEFDGMEGFACEFILHFDEKGERREMPITPELYARLTGPYNRRNVYGAALAGGPRLPRAIWEPIFRHGFAVNGPLRREFGIPSDAINVAVVVRTRTRGREEEWLLQPASIP
jgi:hypothetical protein